MLSRPLEELVSSLFDKALETLSRLTALAVFPHYVRDQMFLYVDSFSSCDAICGLTTVNDEQPV